MAVVAPSREPFDVERERREPTWGDPTLRVLPGEPSQSDIDARHLHINTSDLLIDYNISLPAQRLKELAGQGQIGAALKMFDTATEPLTNLTSTRFGPATRRRPTRTGSLRSRARSWPTVLRRSVVPAGKRLSGKRLSGKRLNMKPAIITLTMDAERPKAERRSAGVGEERGLQLTAAA